MKAVLDTNVLVRHLTGDPPGQARRATAFLAASHKLLLADLVLAEMIYVLESFYERPREEVATVARSLLAFPSIAVTDPDVLVRAVEIYETARIGFADAYVVATAERTGIRRVASFDRTIDKVRTIRRVEP
ncbi:MAG TPA: type II toxin-antitoxin system VapC family toxin [Actinomycetota bacterium]